MAWEEPKTNWQASDVVTANDFNRIEGNIQELQNTKETTTGAQAKADAAANAALVAAKQHTEQQVGNVANALNTHLADTLKHRNIYIVTQPPSPTDGQDGDLFFVYEE